MYLVRIEKNRSKERIQRELKKKTVAKGIIRMVLYVCIEEKKDTRNKIELCNYGLARSVV